MGNLIILNKISKDLEVDLGMTIGSGNVGRSYIHQIAKEICVNYNIRGKFLTTRLQLPGIYFHTMFFLFDLEFD